MRKKHWRSCLRTSKDKSKWARKTGCDVLGVLAVRSPALGFGGIAFGEPMQRRERWNSLEARIRPERGKPHFLEVLSELPIKADRGCGLGLTAEKGGGPGRRK